jgi:hypothetical protein
MQERTLTMLLEMGERASGAQGPLRSAEEVARELESMAQAAGAEADRPQTALEDSMYQSGLQFAYEDSAQGVRAFAAQQPRDSAGRIRALIQEYAGRWADTSGEEAAAFREVMKHLRVVLKAARAGEGMSVYIENLREDEDYSMVYLSIFRRAADELDAIVRECGEEKR